MTKWAPFHGPMCFAVKCPQRAQYSGTWKGGWGYFCDKHKLMLDTIETEIVDVRAEDRNG